MSARLGLGVGRDAVRAVLVRRGAVVWSASAGVAKGETVRDALLRLLGNVPRTWWRRPRVVAAVGPDAAQLKRLPGVPVLTDPGALDQLVAANSARFFLKNGVPLRVSGVHVVGPDEVWAGAIEASAVADVADVCRRLDLQFVGAVPAVAVLGHALRAADGAVTWYDGATCADAVFRDRALVHTRRRPARTDAGRAGCPLPVHPALEVLGEEAGSSLADAYGAAVHPARGPFVIGGGAEVGRRAATTLRRAACVALLVASAAAALVAPAVAAQREAARAAARVSRLELAQLRVARTRHSLVQVSGALRQIADFGARRRSITRLLGALAVAAPESTAFLALRVDSTGGSLVALARRGAALLPALGGSREFGGATISGPVTREAVGPLELERVTIRFHLPPLTGPGAAGGRPAARQPPPR